MIKVPAVEWNGQITELEVESLSKPFVRMSKSLAGTALVDRDEFVPYIQLYDVDETRAVKVTLFVHTDFCRSWPRPDRNEIIAQYAKTHAPWIFSYGERFRIEPINDVI